MPIRITAGLNNICMYNMIRSINNVMRSVKLVGKTSKSMILQLGGEHVSVESFVCRTWPRLTWRDSGPATSVYNNTSLSHLLRTTVLEQLCLLADKHPADLRVWLLCGCPIILWTNWSSPKSPSKWAVITGSDFCPKGVLWITSPKEPPLSATERDLVIKHIWEHCILLSASHIPPLTINKSKQI